MFMALKKKNLIIYVVAALTSVLTFVFFIIGNEVIEEVKEVEDEKDLWKEDVSVTDRDSKFVPTYCCIWSSY